MVMFIDLPYVKLPKGIYLQNMENIGIDWVLLVPHVLLWLFFHHVNFLSVTTAFIFSTHGIMVQVGRAGKVMFDQPARSHDHTFYALEWQHIQALN